MIHRLFYIISLWVATLSMLLSTVMAHHHHMGRICMVVEECQKDGNLNDVHTHHHGDGSQAEKGSCRVHQMHHFFTNAKVMKGIQRHIIDGGQLLFILSSQYVFIPSQALVAVDWQEQASAWSPPGQPHISRRGPPSSFC